MRRRVLQSVVAGLVTLSASDTAGSLPDATADYVQALEGKPSARGKLYVSKGRLRSESELAGGTIALILDPASNQVWLLLPPPLGCVVQPMDDRMRANMPLPLSEDLTEKLVGSETLNGHPTKKYEITSAAGPLAIRYVWRASDFRGFPIKTADESGRTIATFENVVLGKPDPALFRTPSDCKPIPVAAGSATPGPK